MNRKNGESREPETRSPIKDLPVRFPGQSSREHFENFLEDGILFPLMFAGFFLFAAALEWYGYLKKAPRQPWGWTISACLVVIVAAWRVCALRKKARALKLGILGEEAVGQFMEGQLRPLGFQILHDIPAKGFNLDHVVIGPTGVFVVETKTRSKPAKGVCNIRYDGQSIFVNGHKPDRDPIVQVKAEARWLFNFFEHSTGRRVFVQPIIIYPGWFVEPMPRSVDVWVLNEKALPYFIEKARGCVLSPEDIHLLAYHLARYVIG